MLSLVCVTCVFRVCVFVVGRGRLCLCSMYVYGMEEEQNEKNEEGGGGGSTVRVRVSKKDEPSLGRL